MGNISFSLSLSIHIYIYIYTCIHTYTYIYIYIYYWRPRELPEVHADPQLPPEAQGDARMLYVYIHTYTKCRDEFVNTYVCMSKIVVYI